jgi:hypothetical protein
MISSSRVKRGTGNLKRALCENKKQAKEKLLFLAILYSNNTDTQYGIKNKVALKYLFVVHIFIPNVRMRNAYNFHLHLRIIISIILEVLDVLTKYRRDIHLRGTSRRRNRKGGYNE